jgi:hypothetical protein
MQKQVIKSDVPDQRSGVDETLSSHHRAEKGICRQLVSRLGQ